MFAYTACRCLLRIQGDMNSTAHAHILSLLHIGVSDHNAPTLSTAEQLDRLLFCAVAALQGESTQLFQFRPTMFTTPKEPANFTAAYLLQSWLTEYSSKQFWRQSSTLLEQERLNSVSDTSDNPIQLVSCWNHTSVLQRLSTSVWWW